MNISSFELRNKYIHIAYISVIASLLIWGTVGPSLLQAAAQEGNEAKLETLCTHYGQGVVINSGGRTLSISFREWLAIEHSDLVDLFNDVGCQGISAAVTSGEFFGSGFQESIRTSRETVIIDDCGDEDDSTLIRTQTDFNTRTYTGIIEGTSLPAELVGITYINCTPGLIHANLRQIQPFDEVTVAGRTGGAVMERIGTFESKDGVIIVSITERFLCGTGELEGIHGEGVFQREGSRPRPYLFWGHFGHDHETGWEHLCSGLGR